MSLCPVILAGGGGTRLWPLSREYYPKQFLKINSDHSLLQETLMRLNGLNNQLEVMSSLIVCNEAHRFLVSEQMHVIDQDAHSIMLEPNGRNTAPALTVSALNLLTKQDAIIVMMPADHKISDQATFQKALIAGYKLACDDCIVTFAIEPDRPETGYGYIHIGEKLSNEPDQQARKLLEFREKPELHDAESFLASGDYLWNSGIFMMKASVWCEAIKTTRPDIYSSCLSAFEQGEIDGDYFRLHEQSFNDCPSDSIDYAVMEKLSVNDFKTAVIPLPSIWSDVGAWSAVWDISNQDDNNNVIKGDVLTSGTRNCLIDSNHRLVSAVGCENLIIVETSDAVLVADKEHAQDVKNIVNKLKDEQREESQLHRRVYRPWGSYETVDSGENFQVKRLVVNPGKKLSLQSHKQRAEHWVVVTGIATVTRGDDVFELNKDESTYIPVNTRHRLENATNEKLEIIEVQSGDYLGEDDIIRYDDDFGRT